MDSSEFDIGLRNEYLDDILKTINNNMEDFGSVNRSNGIGSTEQPYINEGKFHIGTAMEQTMDESYSNFNCADDRKIYLNIGVKTSSPVECTATNGEQENNSMASGNMKEEPQPFSEHSLNLCSNLKEVKIIHYKVAYNMM